MRRQDLDRSLVIRYLPGWATRAVELCCTPAAVCAETAKELGDVRRFLNRLLGLPIARQNLLFQYFAASLHAAIRRAKAEGRYSEGMSDLPSSSISRDGPPRTLWVDPHSNLRTLCHTLRVDRGVSFEEAQRQLALQGSGAAANGSGFYVSQREIFGRRLVLLASAKPGSGQMFTICRPNTGATPRRCMRIRHLMSVGSCRILGL